ncbi:MAG TPA: hypothetical protein VMH91_03165 [Candidatus Paceibacterota bacterium]|nr:hypothetical protein [Candidatus Paceibacterota bacterium]
MKTSNIIWAIIVVIILVGGWYIWMQSSVPAPTSNTNGPSTALGLNGSPNQGNLGQPDNGQVQQPSTSTSSTGDGSAISDNLTLGVDSKASVGTYLIAYNGMTLYTYSGDSAGVSNCTGSCAVNWPPYTVPAGMHLNLQAGVTGAASTITRADGTTQVTYKGMPLYFFVGDTTSGAVTGDGEGGFSVAKP